MLMGIVTSESGITQLGFIQAIVLGMIQGLTEFIPISSTAHLKVVPVLLGWGDPGVAFAAVIQLGSIAAVFWYFWADLSQLATGSIRSLEQGFTQAQGLNLSARAPQQGARLQGSNRPLGENSQTSSLKLLSRFIGQGIRHAYSVSHAFRISLGIVLGTLPIVLCGLVIKVFEAEYDRTLRRMATIALASIVMSLLLALTEQIGSHKRGYESIGVRDGIWMGLAQTLALIPGVSRSGSTLTAGLFQGLERSTAARFSFLLGLPAITLAGLVELKDFITLGLAGGGLLPLLAGLVASTLFSYLAIAWLIRFLQTQSTWAFVWYRLVFGISILVGIASGIVDNV